jgi:hypothetical protein
VSFRVRGRHSLAAFDTLNGRRDKRAGALEHQKGQGGALSAGVRAPTLFTVVKSLLVSAQRSPPYANRSWDLATERLVAAVPEGQPQQAGPVYEHLPCPRSLAGYWRHGPQPACLGAGPTQTGPHLPQPRERTVASTATVSSSLDSHYGRVGKWRRHGQDRHGTRVHLLALRAPQE